MSRHEKITHVLNTIYQVRTNYSNIRWQNINMFTWTSKAYFIIHPIYLEPLEMQFPTLKVFVNTPHNNLSTHKPPNHTGKLISFTHSTAFPSWWSHYLFQEHRTHNQPGNAMHKHTYISTDTDALMCSLILLQLISIRRPEDSFPRQRIKPTFGFKVKLMCVCRSLSFCVGGCVLLCYFK